MASKFFTFLGLLSLSGSGFAGVTTYAYNPFIRTYAVEPTAYVRSAPLVAAAPVVKTYAAAAPLVQAAAPVVHAAAPVQTEIEEIDPHPQYEFSYNVHDSITGDIKNQVESRDGGNVAGAYSVIDADGYKRTVTYTADDLNGFNAVVQRDPIVAASPVVAKSVAVPVVNAYAASPLVQASPVVKANVVAPVVRATAPIVQAAYAANPVVHANYANAPFVKTYSAAPYYLSSAPVQQYHNLPLQQQVSYLSSPALAIEQQNSQASEQHGDTAVQAQEENQQFAAPQQPANEPTPVEYPQQEQQVSEQNQKQEQPQQNEQQQFIQGQQQIFAEQQQQFAAQQQQVIRQQQQLVEQQQQYFQQQQQQFANNQQFPPYPQYQIPQHQLNHPQQGGNNDSEVIEARSSIPEKQQEAPASEHQKKTAVPTPINEEPKYSANKST